MSTRMDEAVDVGTTKRVSQIFETLAALPELIDPGSVTFRLRDPSGNANTRNVTRESIGVYYSEFVVQQSGQYFFRWETTAPVRAEEGSFLVRRDQYAEGDQPDVYLNWGQFNTLTWGDAPTWGEA